MNLYDNARHAAILSKRNAREHRMRELEGQGFVRARDFEWARNYLPSRYLKKGPWTEAIDRSKNVWWPVWFDLLLRRLNLPRRTHPMILSEVLAKDLLTEDDQAAMLMEERLAKAHYSDGSEGRRALEAWLRNYSRKEQALQSLSQEE